MTQNPSVYPGPTVSWNEKAEGGILNSAMPGSRLTWALSLSTQHLTLFTYVTVSFRMNLTSSKTLRLPAVVQLCLSSRYVLLRTDWKPEPTRL